jgi:hypothetical protein
MKAFDGTAREGEAMPGLRETMPQLKQQRTG